MGGQLSTISIRESSSFSWTIADFCSWEDRFAFVSTSKTFRSLINDDLFWRYMANRLAIEHGVYVPSTVPKNSRTFKNLFRELYPLRRMWEETMSNEELEALSNALTVPRIHINNGEKNKIQVYARFKPKKNNKENSTDADTTTPNDTNEEKEVEVTLPLHQRLAMIKMSHNLTSNRQALRVLTSEGGWFQSRWCDIAQRAEAHPDPSSHSSSTTELSTKPSSLLSPSDNQENENVTDRQTTTTTIDKKSKETMGECMTNVTDNKLQDNHKADSSTVTPILPLDSVDENTAVVNGKDRRGKGTAMAFETDERYILGQNHDKETTIRRTFLPSSFTVRKGKSAGIDVSFVIGFPTYTLNTESMPLLPYKHLQLPHKHTLPCPCSPSPLFSLLPLSTLSTDTITASVQSVDPGTGRVVMIAPDVGLREFTYDGVFPAHASQSSVYDTVAKGLVVSEKALT